MKKHKWTQHEEQYLESHYDNGNGLARCAAYLSIPTNAVKKKAKRLGVSGTRRKFTEAEIDFIKANYSELGYVAIAKILGVKRSSVNTLVVKNLHLHLNPGVRGEISSRTNRTWKRTAATKKKMSDKAKRRTKESNSNWRGGVTPVRTIARRLLWQSWILPIMKRDLFICQDCGTKGVVMNVHHLVPYAKIQREIVAKHPEYDLRKFEDRIEIASLIVQEHKLEDGITLCVKCHKKRHSAKRDELRGTLTTTGEGNPQPSRLNVINLVDRVRNHRPIHPTRASRTPLLRVL
jgi:5-methylcytosine-specific restriction endonuclease McrA